MPRPTGYDTPSDKHPKPLSPAVRALCIAAGAIAAAGWVLSFTRAPRADAGVAAAGAVAIAAGVAWLVFAFVLAGRGRRGEPANLWLDAALLPLLIAAGVFAAGAGFNLGARALDVSASALLLIHAIALLVADVGMGWMFVARAARFDIPRKTALKLWIGALNGPFALAMGLLSSAAEPAAFY